MNDVELQAVELLERAAKILERDGWTVYWLKHPRSERRCVMGGMLAAAGRPPELTAGVLWAETDPVAHTAVAALANVVDPDIFRKLSNWDRVSSWNNRDDRTKEQVLDALRVASMALCNEAEVAT
jgi:hypothetical protein